MNVTTHHSKHPSQRGFTLIEIMVGVAIGLVGLVLIFRTVAVWDAHTRTTTSGGEAQVAGALAIFNLERDIKQAGMGFGTADTADMGCNVAAEDISGGRSFNFPLAPVQIVSAAASAPDQIKVLYGNSSLFVSTGTFTASTATTKKVTRRNGFKPGDLAVVADGTNCALIQITSDSNADGYTLDHANGSFTSFYTSAASAASRFNPTGGTTATFTVGRIYSLGPSPQRNAWQVVNGRTLQRADEIHGTANFEIADGVVNLKAEYGIDSDNNGKITDGTGSTPNEWGTTAPTDWRKLLAVRVGVLVRSSQYVRNPDVGAPASVTVAVTPNAPTWAGGAFAMTNVDGSTDSFSATTASPNNWRYYRYRVYEKVIPLRNMIWGTQP